MADPMHRREFLKQVAAWSAGAAMVPLFDLQLAAAEEKPAKSLVSVAKGKEYEQLVAKVLKPLGGIEAFVKKGDRVVIKPNIGWDRKPEQAANTHPIIVATLVKAALDCGAAKVLVFDHTCHKEQLTYINSGIKPALDAINDARVSCDFLDRRKFMPVDIKGGKSIQRWELYKDALDTDVYINVPIAKHHGLAKLTLGLKNTMGVIGGKRGDIHHDIGQRLADLALVIKPKVTIIDATRILLRNGPVGGKLGDVKVLDTLVASTDPVAADAYATTLFDRKPQDIPATVAAYKAGLGEMDLDKMNIVTV